METAANFGHGSKLRGRQQASGAAASFEDGSKLRRRQQAVETAANFGGGGRLGRRRQVLDVVSKLLRMYSGKLRSAVRSKLWRVSVQRKDTAPRSPDTSIVAVFVLVS